ncbi:anti-anti-sigma factor [Calothrix sp. HK-06]|nr:anti-anti-sigma factor [Calothrix sp. HK-06]
MQQTFIKPKTIVVKPPIFFNAANALDFAQELTTVISQGNCSILVVDFEQVEFLDSTGLMVLVSGIKLAEKLEQRLSLCSISPVIRMIFELTQLDEVFEIVESYSLLLTSNYS